MSPKCMSIYIFLFHCTQLFSYILFMNKSYSKDWRRAKQFYDCHYNEVLCGCYILKKVWNSSYLPTFFLDQKGKEKPLGCKPEIWTLINFAPKKPLISCWQYKCKPYLACIIFLKDKFNNVHVWKVLSNDALIEINSYIKLLS